MRWFWIDRFTEFERGRRAVAIKTVALSEEQFDGYSPGFPVMPGSLMIEGMAQTAGLLDRRDGRFCPAGGAGQDRQGCLSPAGHARRHAALRGQHWPTSRATARGQRDGHVGDELVAEVDLMFAFLDERFPSGPLFEPVDFVAMLRAFHLYDVGRTADGQPLELPEFYADAERAAQTRYEPVGNPVGRWSRMAEGASE